MATRAFFRTKPVGGDSWCAGEPGTLGCQNFIITSGAGAPRTFTGDVPDVFACIAALGSGAGSSTSSSRCCARSGPTHAEQPAQNSGFQRPDAIPQVVLLTNEDISRRPPDSAPSTRPRRRLGDPAWPLQSYRRNEFTTCRKGTPCSPAAPTDLSGTCVSAEDGILLRVADVVSGLKQLKTDPRLIVVSAIAGPPSPYIVTTAPSQVQGDPPWPIVEHSCMSADGTNADPSIRIQQWVDAFGTNGHFQSICDPNLGGAMPLATQLESVMSGSPCLDAGVIASACTFVDQIRDADGGIHDVPLASCAATGGVAPCWSLPAATTCASGRAVQFVRASGTSVASTTATCPAGP